MGLPRLPAAIDIAVEVVLYRTIGNGIDTTTGPCSQDAVDYAQVFVQRCLPQIIATMTEASPLVRHWILLRTLYPAHGVTVKEWAGELCVDEKIIRHDIKAFRTVGFPRIETVRQHGPVLLFSPGATDVFGTQC
jgi:hypothetical protein